MPNKIGILPFLRARVLGSHGMATIGLVVCREISFLGKKFKPVQRCRGAVGHRPSSFDRNSTRYPALRATTVANIPAVKTGDSLKMVKGLRFYCSPRLLSLSARQILIQSDNRKITTSNVACTKRKLKGK